MTYFSYEPILFFRVAEVVPKCYKDCFSRMKINQRIKAVSLPSWAKINLFLAILGKRDDGYHDLLSIISKIDLSDLITIERTGPDGFLECECAHLSDLPAERNLAVKAVIAWREKTGLDFGVRIHILKRIPVQAGLGGGSSNAVSVIIALNRMLSEPFGKDFLIDLATSLGSDCPSFVDERTCIVSGRGERVRFLNQEKSQSLKNREIFLFMPPLGFSTEEIYKGLSDYEDCFSSKIESQDLVDKWESGGISETEVLFNGFEPSIFKKHLYLSPLFEDLSQKYGLMPKVSGSGSCCFCLANSHSTWENFKSSVHSAWGENAFTYRGRILC